MSSAWLFVIVCTFCFLFRERGKKGPPGGRKGREGGGKHIPLKAKGKRGLKLERGRRHFGKKTHDACIAYTLARPYQKHMTPRERTHIRCHMPTACTLRTYVRTLFKRASNRIKPNQITHAPPDLGSGACSMLIRSIRPMEVCMLAYPSPVLSTLLLLLSLLLLLCADCVVSYASRQARGLLIIHPCMRACHSR